MPKVCPTPRSANEEALKPAASLRGEACLGGHSRGDTFVGANADGTEVEWSQRSEFDLLLDFLDTDGNGKVSALELADFVDNLLGTQDHMRPNGSIVFEAVFLTALRHASPDGEDAPSPGPHPGQRPPPPPPPLPPLPPFKSGGGSTGTWTGASTRTDGSDEPADGSTATKQEQHAMAQLHQKQQPLPHQRQLPYRPSASQLQHQQQRLQQQAGAGARGSVLGGSGGGGGGEGFVLSGSVSMKEAQQYGSSRFLSMEAVRKCFADLLADTELWIRMTSGCSIMTTSLFRQLLMYSAERLEKKFSMGVFLRTWGAFNTLPLWLPFSALWLTPRNGTLFLVYLHQLTKLRDQLGPTIAARLHSNRLHVALVVLTMLQFTATYVPLIAYIAAHAIPAIRSSRTVVDFMHANPMADQISLFGSILPLAVLQFLTSSAALKLSCRDFISLKEQCKAVFMLGDVSSQFEGYRGLTIRSVMDAIKGRVELSISRSTYRRVNALMPLVFSLALETFRRAVRMFLVRNLVAKELLGKVVAPFEVYALVYNIWFAYSESADCTAYLYKLRKISSVFRTLLSKEESLSQALPWLNNHSPRNLLLWSRLRRYYQSPNCLELRWIEMHLTLVVVAAIAVTVILVVTFVQKTLLRFRPENADLQLFMVWVIPAFIYLLLALVIDVIMSASTGLEYHDGVMTLSAEAVFIEDRLNSAEEIVRHRGEPDDGVEWADGPGEDSDGERPLALAAPALADPGRKAVSSPPAAPSSASGRRGPADETGLVRRVTGCVGGGSGPEDDRDSASELGCGAGAPGDVGGGRGGRRAVSSSLNGVRPGSGSGSGGRGGGECAEWVPAVHYRLSRVDRARLRQCRAVIKSLVSYIQFNAEYITIFGVPIDTHLRNTLFSVSVTLVGAGISAFLAIVVKKN